MATKAEMNQLKARLEAAELAAARWHATAEVLANKLEGVEFWVYAPVVQSAVKSAYEETAWVKDAEKRGAPLTGKRLARRERIETAAAKKEARESKRQEAGR